MLLEGHFQDDARVRQEAYKLVDAGYTVTLISQFSEIEKKAKETINGVTIYRIPLVNLFSKSTTSTKRTTARNWLASILFRGKSILGYLFEYVYFTGACFLLSLYIGFREGFDIIHLHNPPNSPFLIGAFYKIFGKKFVFDHHDLAPELYLARYRRENGLVYKVLLLEEKLCLMCADMVIATNESYKEIDIKRAGKDPRSIFVVRNGPDLRDKIFQSVPPDENLKRMGKTILVYIGIMGPQDGVDYLIRSLWILAYELKREDFYCLIIGRGDELENLRQLSHDLRMDDYIRFTGFVPREDLTKCLSTADICLDPNPSNSLNDHSTWVKVLEYMTFGKPIVSFDLKETRYSAQEAAVYARPNDEESFARAIVHLMDNPEEREQRGAVGRKRMHEVLQWQHVSKNLVLGYNWLCNHSAGYET